MGATSVTGVGSGSGGHQYLGVNKLIGLRWNEQREKVFKRNNIILYTLVFTQIATLVWMFFK